VAWDGADRAPVNERGERTNVTVHATSGPQWRTEARR